MAVVSDNVTGAEVEVCVVGVELMLVELHGTNTDTVAAVIVFVDWDNRRLARSFVAFGTETQ